MLIINSYIFFYLNVTTMKKRTVDGSPRESRIFVYV